MGNGVGDRGCWLAEPDGQAGVFPISANGAHTPRTVVAVRGTLKILLRATGQPIDAEISGTRPVSRGRSTMMPCPRPLHASYRIGRSRSGRARGDKAGEIEQRVAVQCAKVAITRASHGCWRRSPVRLVVSQWRAMRLV